MIGNVMERFKCMVCQGVVGRRKLTVSTLVLKALMFERLKQ